MQAKIMLELRKQRDMLARREMELRLSANEHKTKVEELDQMIKYLEENRPRIDIVK